VKKVTKTTKKPIKCTDFRPAQHTTIDAKSA
jgi:hypothetical protein